ncbi:alpha/beta hydrolase [Colwellia sp. MSW7]|uniref:Alpha/beta hydrolase n=1 Tax=Colwellia maritima TaxID=2912588 RepID=A0ABS9X698_9GAMM|nr:alpha/beta hydrolase [Colwellia maritima]MCI2285763.1 alpha/beta hydrolase [Colwellia maritima]
MTLEHKHVLIDDVNIHYVMSMPTNPKKEMPSTLVFLHGFPEYWQAWQGQLDYFSKHHCVIAPDLPGYNLSDKPLDTTFFKITNLIEFFAKFINIVSPSKKVTLVAHDWGGAIAWPLAAFYPQYIAKLVILNAAHPSTFTREMINNPEQRKKSAYIHDLISPQAETLLSKDNYQYLSEKIMVSTSPTVFTEKLKLAYREAWQRPGAINGMLQYYRAIPQLAPTSIIKRTQERSTDEASPVKSTTDMKVPTIHIHVPTLILWGEQDQAFVTENLNDIERYVPDCEVRRFPKASHWLMHEKTPEINETIADFIGVD